MIRTRKQQGSAHVVVVIVLVLALITALGWIFWQNFVYKEPTKTDTQVVNVDSEKNNANTQSSNTSNAKVVDPYEGWNTYTASSLGITFRYPADWTLSDTGAGGTGVNAVMLNVKNANGDEIAHLNANPSGVGGAGDPTEYTVLKAKKLNIPTKNQSYSVFIAHGNKAHNSSSYALLYGVTDEVNNTVSGQAALFYLMVHPSTSTTVWFQGASSNSYASLDAARAYYASGEGQQIWKMLGSLKIAE